jgi:hypothetical protein
MFVCSLCLAYTGERREYSFILCELKCLPSQNLPVVVEGHEINNMWNGKNMSSIKNLIKNMVCHIPASIFCFFHSKLN